MPSTYSALKIELMATGEKTSTWGTVTNTNLGTAIEEAIVGSANVTFSSADVTLTLTDSNASQIARNMRLRCIGTTGGATRNLVVPSIEKPYIVQNDCADSVVVKTSAGTGVTVPAGKSMWVYSDGTNVVDVVTHLSSLSLTTPVPIAQGGTGAGTASGARTNLGLGTMATQNANAVAITGGTVSGITDLAVADGGTGASDASGARTNLGATTVGANLFTLVNPSAITFLRFNADNTVSALSASDFRNAIGAGTSSTVGTVTSVSGTGSVNGLTLTGTVTASGSITLGGSITSVASNATINGVTIGYRDIPISGITSGTISTDDIGECVAATGGITVPSGTFSGGNAVSIYNDTSSSITITQGAGLTLRQSGTSNTGNRTLAARGMATIWFRSASEAVIMGSGLT